ncbi:MAG TPA: hypothetical protein DHV31_02215 [Clostridiales bacterium]|nr:hypothetical protein [Clostridiales bacterium]
MRPADVLSAPSIRTIDMFFKGEPSDIVRNYPMAERGSARRIWELDFLRGFTILLMCIDHLMFDLSSTIGFYAAWSSKGGAAGAVANFASMWWDRGVSWVGQTREIV